jgi:hypothetical protein
MVDEMEAGTPIRDIVIETRVDVKHIREALDEISQCIKEHDERLRRIEILGSEVTQENSKDLVKLQVRVQRLETGEEVQDTVVKAKTHWIDSIWAKIGIGAGVFFAFISFVKSYWT